MLFFVSSVLIKNEETYDFNKFPLEKLTYYISIYIFVSLLSSFQQVDRVGVVVQI